MEGGEIDRFLNKKWGAQNRQKSTIVDLETMIEIYNIQNHRPMNFGQSSLIDDFCRIFSPLCTPAKLFDGHLAGKG